MPATHAGMAASGPNASDAPMPAPVPHRASKGRAIAARCSRGDSTETVQGRAQARGACCLDASDGFARQDLWRALWPGGDGRRRQQSAGRICRTDERRRACASSGGHWEWPELRLPTRRRLVRPFGHRRGAPAGAQPANIALSRAAGGRVLLRDGDKGSVAVADDQVGVGRQGRVAVHRRADVDVEQCWPRWRRVR